MDETNMAEAKLKASLKESKACENIAINNIPEAQKEASTTNIMKSSSVKTVFENPAASVLSSSEEISGTKTKVADEEVKPNVVPKVEETKTEPPSNVVNRKSTENIYSVKGTPSRRLIRRPDTFNILQADLTPSKSNIPVAKTSSSKLRVFRNPVTGIGVNSNDEYKAKPTKKKDGNPVLGLGYDDKKGSSSINSKSSQKIPPGGYSHGLW